jgi:Domain of unknown function (DUF4388)
MALEGTLRDFSLADIFQLIGLQRKTGVLTLRSSEDVVTISFLDGRVVAADSLNKRLEDRLGQVILKTGMVGQDELDAALRTQMETLERLGHILLRNAVLSRDQLRRALEQQILQIIYRVFRWNDGDYHFSQETSIDYDVELVTPMGAESILMEGARMLDEWPIIEKAIPDRQAVLVATTPLERIEIAVEPELDGLEELDLEPPEPRSAPPLSNRIRMSPLEATVFRLLDGARSVEEVIRLSPYGEFETCKSLYTLLTRGLLRYATSHELASAQRDVASPSTLHLPAARLPWLALLVAPLLVIGQLAAHRNPANPILGPGPKLLARAEAAWSWARMWGVWEALHARATLVGSFPDNLAELAGNGLLPDEALHDPWMRAYRYVLREQSLLLAGSTPQGVPDPNLMLTQHLPAEKLSEENQGRGAELLEH